MAKIKINVSGRIPKYFFGVLNEKYRDEVKESLQYCNDDVETENDFLNLVFSLTLDGPNEPKEELFNVISKEDLEKLPNFNELVNNFIENGGSHFEIIDCLFDNPDLKEISTYSNNKYISVPNDASLTNFYKLGVDNNFNIVPQLASQPTISNVPQPISFA
jgi:hypothetical protein